MRKPGVAELLKADLGFLALATKALEFVAPSLGRISLAAVAADVRAAMLDELDFEKEAANLDAFGDFLDANGLRGAATCPRVVRDHGVQPTARVLTMERLRGAPPSTSRHPRARRREPRADARQRAQRVGALGRRVRLVPRRRARGQPARARRRPRRLHRLWDRRPHPAHDVGGAQLARRAAAAADFGAAAPRSSTLGATDGDVDVVALAADLRAIADGVNALTPELVVVDERAVDGGVSAQLGLDEREVATILLDIVVAATERHGVLPREFGLLVKQALYFDRYTKLSRPSSTCSR